MAPSSSSSSSTSSKASASTPPQHFYPSPIFTPIRESEREEEEQAEDNEERGRTSGTTPTPTTERQFEVKHHPTPVHHSEKSQKQLARKRTESYDGNGDDLAVSCNKCRPNSREKISVVPLDNSGLNKQSSSASPNGIFKSIFSSLTKKSPSRPLELSVAAREEQWKIAIAELSHKLIQATRKRDEALLESSKLKYSMAELEKKLNKLEIYCHNLKSGLEVCTTSSPHQIRKVHNTSIKIGDQDKVVEHFLVSVSEARSSVRLLSRALTIQLRQLGAKVYDRISSLLQPYDIKIPFSKNPRSLLFYLEALLNKAFFEDFESIEFQKNSANQILNPIDRCEANFASFTVLQGLTWEDVLNKGTKHFSGDFSKFCDRKMSEIVAMLGWNRAWPEPLLQSFFGASKNVWLVHLLANSVHPSLTVFRVDKGMRFDSVYMEDMGGAKARRLVPTMVRIMVAPGFYVYGNVVKCKVLSRYYNNNYYNNDDMDNGLTPSPS